MRTAILFGVFVSLLSTVVSTVQARIIYYDSFDGPSGVDLNGKAPIITTNGAVWNAGSDINADGIIAQSVGQYSGDSTYLPFTPESGYIYELSVTMDCTAGDWMGVGFTQNKSPADRFLEQGVYWWALTRGPGLSLTTYDQTFVGLRTNGAQDTSTRGEDDILILLDTTDQIWILQWYFGGDLARTEEVSDPEVIKYVSFSTSQSGGIISRFKLEIPKSQASQPSPEDGQTDVPPDVVLMWTPGEFAGQHDIYLGTDFNDVNDATPTDDPNFVYMERSDSNVYPDAGTIRLDIGRRYFWRVDEVNAPPNEAIYKGVVWSFGTEPFTYPISDECITATASSYVENSSPVNTINSSGLVNGLHSIDTATMWLSDSGEPGSASIEYEFDKAYKLNQMLVWNYNGPLILWGFGIRDVTVEYSNDGDYWTQIDTVSEFAPATRAADYACNNTVDFNDVAVKNVRIFANSNWSGGLLDQYGLSEVCFMYKPVSAREPSPVEGATEVAVDVTLGWRPGREADQHYIYLSTDRQAVIDGTIPFVTVPGEAGYGPLSLNMASTYYWRVDEVNNNHVTPVWRGDTWSFSTNEYHVVDDFESYNDLNPEEEDSNRIFLTWTDGYDNPTFNGSTIGYSNPDFTKGEHFVETKIVHSGSQSAPLSYDNTVAGYSEVTVGPADLAIGRNWAKGGACFLVFWFYGDPNNDVTEQMYVKINGAKVIYDGDVDDIKKSQWTQWKIDLTSLGVNLKNVVTFSIGFERIEDTGGTGTVFIDDIRLYKILPAL